VIDARTGDRLSAGTIYLAKPDRHLVFNQRGTFSYMGGMRIRFLLSAANPLFESAARVFGPRAIAVVLTGSGTDATDGVQAVRTCGGIVIAQDPATVTHASMPTSAIATGAVDHILPIAQIAPKLIELVGAGASQRI
jgi:two-component system chemotaxis response regulator CheB